MALPVSLNYDQGEVAIVSCTFTDPQDTTTTPLDPVTGNALIDPAGAIHVVCLRQDGSYVRLTYQVDQALSRVSQGIYRASIPCDVGGLWDCRFYSDAGRGQASVRFRLIVAKDTLV